MAKLSFDQAMARINDGRFVKASEISARALKRKVWVAEWHLPGCLSESQSICLTKAQAIEDALSFADSPKGMKTTLRKHGRFDSDSEVFGTCINTVFEARLSDLL